MPFDTNLLLTAETLRLSSDLTRGQAIQDTFAVRSHATGKYLILDETQARVLNEFAQPRTVPEVLEDCIRNRKCPALREFYALIVNANDAGVLCGELAPPSSAEPAVRWLATLPPKLALFAVVLSVLAAVAVPILKSPTVPATWLQVAASWAAASGAASLGHVLAATTLRGAGCEVYRPRLRWLFGLIPHFAVDLRDACMASRSARAAIHSSVVVPLALVSAVGGWLGQPWAFVSSCALLLEFRPVGGSIANVLFDLLRRKPLRSTDQTTFGESELTLGEQLGFESHQIDWRTAMMRVGFVVAWITVAIHFAARAFRYNLVPHLRDWQLWRTALIGLAVGIVAAVGLWFANLVQYRVVRALKVAWRAWVRHWHRWITPPDPMLDPAKIESLVRNNPLLGRLDFEAQTELIARLQPYAARPWKKIIAFEEDPPFVALIVSGSISIYRRHKTGRRSRFLRLIEGDLFGAHKLVDPDYPSLEVLAKTPVRALTLTRDEFVQLVVNKLGARIVRSYAHKQLFLLRTASLCAKWRPTAVERLAELAATTTHQAGGKIVCQGQQVVNLCILYEGRARALRGSKQIGTLKPGDMFGEISVLQSSAATADVEIRDEARLLLINRADFIRFIARNYRVALMVERLCSRRLGYPIFPLDGDAFQDR
jgi:CRP-like cAMP-binding protein